MVESNDLAYGDMKILQNFDPNKYIFPPLTLKEQQILRVFEDKIFMQIFGSKSGENGERLTLRSFIVYTVHLK